MTSYLGNLSALVPVECAAEVAVASERDSSTRTTLGGRRFARMAPEGRRAWSLRSSSLDGPSDLAPVQLFADGSWGDGPFWWLSPWATHVNILTPGGSVLAHADLAGATVAGPVKASDGTWFPVSTIAPSSGIHAVARSSTRNWVPVPPDAMYTASLYVSNGQRVRVLERAETTGGTLVERVSQPATGPGLRRVSVTAHARADTNLLIMEVVGAGACAGAAISLTSALQPWGVGDGCEAAIVRDGGLDVTSLSYAPYAGQSYEVLEVA